MASALIFREVGPTDLSSCVVLEQASYPEDEAASKSTLQYRQHQAAPFFRCAVLSGEDDEDEGDTVVGFICATRCTSFTHESMTTHLAGGPLLAVHSVVVREEYRRRGIATSMMKEYIHHVQDYNKNNLSTPVQSIVMMAKAHLLTFYINVGFRVNRLSPILHGSERWYELQQEIMIPWNHRCWVVDAFADADKRGTGNPAGVVLMRDDADFDDGKTRAWMQTVAQEFNLSETAFVSRRRRNPPSSKEGDNTPSENNEQHYNIRYYTPSIEVPLCGHATLSAAALIYQHTSAPSKDSIVFHAPKDTLRANLRPSSLFRRGQRRITMSFPSKPATEIIAENERNTVGSMLLEAFSFEKEEILFMGLSDIGDLLIEIKSERFQALSGSHRFDALLKCDVYSRGVILCCRPPVSESACEDQSHERNGGDSSKEKVDFYSRFFAPKAGIDEDPVTGSAHCVLAPYFCELLKKATVIGHQQSSRGGFVECTLVPSNQPSSTSGLTEDADDRIELTGLAVTTLGGRLQ
mmetsp:Transcript_12264/g.34009  ORF Transcript_12264/g.34009 Transcript_12264/m.34009 type:complete len:522 (+) Transcript_12264:266-1831(+)